jgi:ribosomal subunit interface protein
VLTRLLGVLRALVDLVLPAPCGGCGATLPPGAALCAACTETLARPLPAPERPDLPPAMALAPYTGPARHAVIAYKERGRRDLAVPLAEALGEALTRLTGDDGDCVLVPAPSRPGAARVRGGDHMLRIAHRLERAGHGHALRALALSRGARDSVGLDAAARAANLAAHLRVRPGSLSGLPARHGPVVLLDDVLTTGATAVACAAALEAAGLPVDLVLVLTAVGARRPRVPGRALPRAASGVPTEARPLTREAGPPRASPGPIDTPRVGPPVAFPRPGRRPLDTFRTPAGVSTVAHLTGQTDREEARTSYRDATGLREARPPPPPDQSSPTRTAGPRDGPIVVSLLLPSGVDVEIVICGRNVEVPEHFRDHTAEKLTRLGRYDHKIIRLSVELSHENNPRRSKTCQSVEITGRGRGPVVRAVGCAGDFYSALDQAVQRIEERLRRAHDRRLHKAGRRRVAVGAGGPAEDLPSSGAELDDALPTALREDPFEDREDGGFLPAAAIPAAREALDDRFGREVSGDGPGRIARVKEHEGVPMTVDDALSHMELVGHDFFLFSDKSSGRPSVVYRRRGYDYGVISLV